MTTYEEAVYYNRIRDLLKILVRNFNRIQDTAYLEQRRHLEKIASLKAPKIPKSDRVFNNFLFSLINYLYLKYKKRQQNKKGIRD